MNNDCRTTALPHSGKRKKAVVQQTYQHAYEAVAFWYPYRFLWLTVRCIRYNGNKFFQKRVLGTFLKEDTIG